MTFETTLLATTTCLTALLAGVFFAYAVSVNGGLRRLKDAEYVRAMQSINQVIQNPLFFLVFMGPVILLPWTTYLFKDDGQFGLLLGACILYIVGSFGLTIVGNVPLNERLARVDASSSAVSSARQAFEKPWNLLHSIRTIASVVAMIVLIIACVS